MNPFLIFLLFFAQTLNAQVTMSFALNSTPDIQIDLFRCYLTDVEIHYADGTVYRDTCRAYLLNVEDPASMHLKIPGAPNKEKATLSFRVGTDSTLNVAGILDGALDPIRGMYWAWNTGYVNLKMEGTYQGQAFEYHIGGYRSPYTTDRVLSIPIDGQQEMIEIEVLEWLRLARELQLTSLMIPGAEAARLADAYSLLFSSGHAN